uniref:Coagulation factor IX n=1 Tax=Xiphophorus maculatus TaxID=8083 RepID=A0A3B5QWZ1_XIPMA
VQNVHKVNAEEPSICFCPSVFFSETVFISQQKAHVVLKRQRRFNSGRLEEVLQKANLERECREEQCTMEEAREWFEDNEKTMQFWSLYTDGDQCESKPCQNGGVCEDELSSYKCWCKKGFIGKNCEIETAKQCSINNGGCAHFCKMEGRQRVCHCAAGYEVGTDRKSCEPTVGLDSSSSLNQAETINSTAELDDSKSPRQKRSWDLPVLPTIVAQKNVDERIVGGDEATPGEIPWQVVLLNFLIFYCFIQCQALMSSTFPGEHDVNVVEASESNHEVAEEHIHPRYNSNHSQFNHDIALLKLATPVELSNERRPICVGPSAFIQDLLKDSSSSVVSGWGRLRDKGLEADKLQKLSAPLADRTLCKQSSRDHITRFMFCAGFADGLSDSCQGDSGGPHATNYKGTWFLTGIVSWGEGCAEKGKYGIYTRVSRYYSWIVQTTGILQSN